MIIRKLSSEPKAKLLKGKETAATKIEMVHVSILLNYQNATHIEEQEMCSIFKNKPGTKLLYSCKSMGE